MKTKFRKLPIKCFVFLGIIVFSLMTAKAVACNLSFEEVNRRITEAYRRGLTDCSTAPGGNGAVPDRAILDARIREILKEYGVGPDIGKPTPAEVEVPSTGGVFQSPAGSATSEQAPLTTVSPETEAESLQQASEETLTPR